ncbi:hypothetical protein HPB50_027781 [Hyalomma asiaticum]|nr:hypothetical protein HPB50_027781 [Hyalomma asiaticum]
MKRVLRTSSGACDTKVGLSGYVAELSSRMDVTLDLAHSNLAKARAGQKAQYDWSHRDMHYNVSDLVHRCNHVLSDAAEGISASLSAK